MADKIYPYLNLSLKNISGEKWKELPELGDHYLISDYGRVKSLSRYFEVFIPKQNRSTCYWSKERIRKIKVHRKWNSVVDSPYYECTISMRINGEEKTFMVHRLVYNAFINPINFIEDSLVITHKDGDGLNNYFENLQAMYKSDAQKKSYLKKRHVSPFALKSKEELMEIVHRSASSKHKPIIQKTLEGKEINKFDSIKHASKHTGIPDSNIINVLKKRRVHAGGFRWEYLLPLVETKTA